MTFNTIEYPSYFFEMVSIEIVHYSIWDNIKAISIVDNIKPRPSLITRTTIIMKVAIRKVRNYSLELAP